MLSHVSTIFHDYIYHKQHIYIYIYSIYIYIFRTLTTSERGGRDQASNHRTSEMIEPANRTPRKGKWEGFFCLIITSVNQHYITNSYQHYISNFNQHYRSNFNQHYITNFNQHYISNFNQYDITNSNQHYITNQDSIPKIGFSENRLPSCSLHPLRSPNMRDMTRWTCFPMFYVDLPVVLPVYGIKHHIKNKYLSW